MASELKLPELGENIESGTVVSLAVKAGDTLEKDQTIMELETDKAVIEVPAEEGGTVEKLHVSEGGEVSVGQVIVTLGSAGTSSVSKEGTEKSETEENEQEHVNDNEENKIKAVESATEPAKPVRGPAQKVEFKIPELGENIESGNVASLLVKKGDKVEKDQSLLELETDKAVLEVPSDVAGVIEEIKIKEGDQAKVGQVVFIINAQTESAAQQNVADNEPEPEKQSVKPEQSEPVVETAEPAQQKPAEIPKADHGYLAPAAPSVRRFAREIGININKVQGSGPGGRISVEDVKAYSKMLNQQKETAGPLLKGVQDEPLPDFSKWGEIDRHPMNKVREKTAEHLSYAWATIPHVTQFDKADITELEKLRKQYAPQVEKAGGKLTVTAILLKVVERALKIYPQFNASIDMQNQELIYKKYYNIGVAADTDRGLLVPVIKDVDKKNITQLSVELSELSEKARSRKLSLEEMQGGNFSISNLGGIGGTAFTPIVNSPEVAILGVSRGRIEPVFVEGEFLPRMMLPLSLSYDHRIIDGADAARFLRWICQALEQPFLLSLEG